MVRYKKLLAVIQYFWKGRASRERREAGVGFAIRSNTASKLHELPRGINDRLMTLRLHLHGDRHATIISAYAPTLVSDEEEKQQFYDNLRDVLQAVLKGDKIVLTGDFNARVGRLADLGQLRMTWGWEYEWKRSTTILYKCMRGKTDT